jgi:NAD+ kinase
MKNGTKVLLFYRNENKRARLWAKRIKAWIKNHYPKVRFVESKPQVVIALGGDGAILEAARTYQKDNALILGLNLGQIGFLASVRKSKNFLPELKKFFNGDYSTTQRMMLQVSVYRKNKIVYLANILNDVVVQNPFGIAEIEVLIGGYSTQFIRGTGVLVSTATGSTAFNLSAHGPIVMPDIHCMIITELLDHNIPTPSIVIKPDKVVKIKILDFRSHGLLFNKKTKQPADVLLSADGGEMFSLEKGDEVKITSSSQLVSFVELEKNYFLKSIQEKFSFK